MKTLNYIFGIIIIIAVAVFAVWEIKSHSHASQTATNSTPQSLCYIWNTDAGDKATIKMSVSGSDVNGTFNFIPAEKDSMTGPFAGTISAADASGNRLIESTWTASAEGMTNQQALNIQVTPTTAAAGFGAMENQNRGDQTAYYAYADESAISYAPVLQKTDCSDSAL